MHTATVLAVEVLEMLNIPVSCGLSGWVINGLPDVRGKSFLYSFAYTFYRA